MTDTIKNNDVNDIPNFDVNDIKNYKSTDPEYYMLYMRKRYKDIVGKSVACDICKCSVVYSGMARHTKTQKCINHNITVIEKFVDKTTMSERVEKLEKMLALLTIKS